MSVARNRKTRPPLPLELLNPLLKTAVVEKDPVVKYQIIEREGQEIVIGRVKVPTPNSGHAFILRRYDTGAVSLTTMFRAAFPEASDEDEKNDTAWIKQAYDIAGANGGYRGNARQFLRLAGTWLPVDVALMVAESYALHGMVKPLTEAEPPPDQLFRKSIPSTNGNQEVTEIKPPSAAAPPAVKATSPPTKRRRAVSPAPAPVVPLSPPVPSRKLRSSKSPAPTKAAATAKPRSSKRLARKTASPPIDVDDDDSVPEIGAVDPEVDIAESKQLVKDIKAGYVKPMSKASGMKRAVEDETITFEPKDPEVGERVIAGPRRLRNLPPQRQAVAWGALAFAVGLGATAFLPQFFL